jgi:DNA-binding NtrC family response regulator
MQSAYSGFPVIPCNKENSTSTGLRIAQASVDHTLAATREALLTTAGHSVTTFQSVPQLLEICKSQKFDLLIIGHLLEYADREKVRKAFRILNPGVPVLQFLRLPDVLSGMDATDGANYVFDVMQGPEALLKCVNGIVGLRMASPSKTWAREKTA